jgi:hypothetical protein
VSGLLRNLLAFVVALFAQGSKAVDEETELGFWVTPLDTGIRVLKSDKYLQFAETAQVDYLVKTRRFFPILRSGANFVNVAQLVRFFRPVAMFGRVRVRTRLIYADDKCAYFSHQVHASGGLAAEVLVKMKFKKGRLTVAPGLLLPTAGFSEIPAQVLALEPALAAR